MNGLIIAAALLLVAYCAAVVLIWRYQERIVFQPPSISKQTTAQTRRVSYRAADGTELVAHIVGECGPENTVVLAFHGNADVAWWLLPWATRVSRVADACVVLPEYRGYDGLAGSPTYAASAVDARAALDYVRTVMAIPQRNIVYFGHSLGSAIATELTTYAVPRALVLQSPFSSANDMSRRFLIAAPTFLLDVISRVHFNTAKRVATLECPVWVAHGDQDMIVPVAMGREVFAASRRKGEMLSLASAGHNDVAEAGGDEYLRWIDAAINDGREASATPAARGEKRSAP